MNNNLGLAISRNITAKSARKNPWQDRYGVQLSLLCLVHCLAMPLGLLILNWFGVHFAEHDGWHHFFHLFLFPLVIITTGTTLLQGARQSHQYVALGMGILGLFFLIFPEILPMSARAETSETVVGSLLLLVAHWQNRVQLRRVACCG